MNEKQLRVFIINDDQHLLRDKETPEEYERLRSLYTQQLVEYFEDK